MGPQSSADAGHGRRAGGGSGRPLRYICREPSGHSRQAGRRPAGQPRPVPFSTVRGQQMRTYQTLRFAVAVPGCAFFFYLSTYVSALASDYLYQTIPDLDWTLTLAMMGMAF